MSTGTSQPSITTSGIATLDDAIALMHAERLAWFEIPGTQMRMPDGGGVLLKSGDFATDLTPLGAHPSPSHVIKGWTGGAFDGATAYFMGGGHNGYNGNEIYTFHFPTLTNTRLTDPALPPPIIDDARRDVLPRGPDGEEQCPSIHSRDGVFYRGDSHSILYFGGEMFYKNGHGMQNVWEFFITEKRWAKRTDQISGSWKCVAETPEGKIYVLNAGSRILYEYDYEGDFFTEIGSFTNRATGQLTYDPEIETLIFWAAPDKGWTIRIPARITMMSMRDGLNKKLTFNSIKPRYVPVRGSLPPVSIHDAGLHYMGNSVWLVWPNSKENSTELWTVNLNPDSEDFAVFTHYMPPGGPDLSLSKAKCFSKFFEVAPGIMAQYNDVKQGMWLLDLNEALKDEYKQLVSTAPSPLAPALVSDPTQEPADLTALVLAASAGDTVVLPPGLYHKGIAIPPGYNNLTLDMTGVGIDGGLAQGGSFAGKGAIVCQSDDLGIINGEIFNINVSSGNGACLRMEGRNATIRGSHFHDSQEGVLGKLGTLTLVGEKFERLGGAPGSPGRSHGAYWSKGAEEFIANGGSVLSMKDQGHGFKSRAKRTTITGVTLGELEGVGSYLVDAPNGGDLLIQGSVLEIGPNSSNRSMISYGTLADELHPRGSIKLNNNIFIIDRSTSRLINFAYEVPVYAASNIVIGGTREDFDIHFSDPSNMWYPSRKAYGIVAFPFLPEPMVGTVPPPEPPPPDPNPSTDPTPSRDERIAQLFHALGDLFSAP